MIGKVLVRRYRIDRKIGEGGMATVYHATDLNTSREVAVKFLKPEYLNNPEYRSRFKDEADMARRLMHHNIVNLLYVSRNEKEQYLVFEYVSGTTLKERILKHGRLENEVAVQIAVRILAALSYAHDKKIIHRDIKPQNILMDENNYVKVADFGIARLMEEHTKPTDSEQEKSVLGSVHYYSPEQAMGKPVTAASDLYSVGVVLYEMLTGIVPFDAEEAVDIAAKHINESPRPLRELNPDVPVALENVVLKALSKDPSARYQSALLMAQALQEALALKEIQNQPPPRPKPPLNRKKIALSNIAVLVLGICVLALTSFGIFTIYRQVVSTTKAPYLLGESEESAIRLIERAGLVPKVERMSSKEEPGTVILQSHDFDYTMHQGDALLITVSCGPVRQPIPDLKGSLQQNAMKTLERHGFQLLAVEQELSDLPLGTVISQVPEPGTEMDYGGIVQVHVSGGRVSVPQLLGQKLQEAEKTLKKDQLKLGQVSFIRVKDAQQDQRIAAQKPEAGEIVMADTPIVVAVYTVSESPSATESGKP